MAATDKDLLYLAAKDISAIEVLSKDVDSHTEVISFHAQQAAEKMIRHALHERGIPTPKTHDIEQLIGMGLEHGVLSPTKEDIAAATKLTWLAVNARHQTAIDIRPGEALNAMVLCNQIADMLERSGSPSVRIHVPAALLHDESPSMDSVVGEASVAEATCLPYSLKDVESEVRSGSKAYEATTAADVRTPTRTPDSSSFGTLED